MDYSEYHSNISSGDLIVFSATKIRTTYDLLSYIVRLFTMSEYNHVGIAWVIGDSNLIVEAQVPEVKISPLKKLGSFYHIPMGIDFNDNALGRIASSLNNAISYPRCMTSWMTYQSLPPHTQQEFKELIKEIKVHDAYVAEVMTNLDVTLNSCTTVKKLREVWVNGSEIIDKALGQSQQSPTVHMPMVAIQTLDALVPLP